MCRLLPAVGIHSAPHTCLLRQLSFSAGGFLLLLQDVSEIRQVPDNQVRTACLHAVTKLTMVTNQLQDSSGRMGRSTHLFHVQSNFSFFLLFCFQVKSIEVYGFWLLTMLSQCLVQEVYADAERDESVVVELLELKADVQNLYVANMGPSRDSCQEQDATLQTVTTCRQM